MSKTITIPTQAQLKQYHLELQQREKQETKDKCILLALAFAGLIGVYALVMNGVAQSNITQNSEQTLDQNVHQKSDEKAVVVLP